MNEKKNGTKLEALTDDSLGSVAGGYGGEVTASGSFASQTGTGLNIYVSWNAQTDMFGQKTLNVTVSASSYSLFSGASANGVELSVNGMTYVATPNAINYSGNTMAMNVLAGFTIPNAVGPAYMTAVWHFNGTYSGVPISSITASGVATF